MKYEREFSNVEIKVILVNGKIENVDILVLGEKIEFV